MARSTNIHRNILIDACTDIHRNALVDGSMYSLSLPLQLRYLEGWQAVQGGGGVDVHQGVVGWALVWLLVVGWWLAHRYCGQLSLRCMCPLPPFPPPSRCCRLNLKWGRRGGGTWGLLVRWQSLSLSLSLSQELVLIFKDNALHFSLQTRSSSGLINRCSLTEDVHKMP